MTQIKLSKKAQQMIEGARNQTPDQFDFNTAPPQKPVRGKWLNGIESMTRCLHGNPCPYLDGPGGRRPMCSATKMPVFDMERCPLGCWFKYKGRG